MRPGIRSPSRRTSAGPIVYCSTLTLDVETTNFHAELCFAVPVLACALSRASMFSRTNGRPASRLGRALGDLGVRNAPFPRDLAQVLDSERESANVSRAE